jgi:transposase, IS5 family
VLRTLGDPVSLWESLLPEEVLRLPAELARVDGLLDDPVFFAPFVPFFSLTAGRPSTPVECYSFTPAAAASASTAATG